MQSVLSKPDSGMISDIAMFKGLYLTVPDSNAGLVNKWPKTMEACRNVVTQFAIFLRAGTLKDKEVIAKVEKFILSGQFAWLMFSMASEEAFKLCVKEYEMCSDEDFMLLFGEEADLEDGAKQPISRTAFWGYIMIVFLSLGKTNNASACHVRYISACKQAGTEPDELVTAVFTKLIDSTKIVSISAVGQDPIEIFHNSLWKDADFARSQIKNVLKMTGDGGIAIAALSQIKMVYHYSQMTMVKFIREFMLTSQTSVRIMPKAINEYKALLAALNSIKSKHPDVEEDHFRLLQLPECTMIESSKFPFLSTITSLSMSDAAGMIGRQFKMNVDPMTAKLVRAALEHPLPSKYRSTGDYAIPPEDLELVGIFVNEKAKKKKHRKNETESESD